MIDDHPSESGYQGPLKQRRQKSAALAKTGKSDGSEQQFTHFGRIFSDPDSAGAHDL
jgi:hypothetical protein